MAVLLGSQFILYTHLIIKGIISTVLCRNLVPWVSLQNTTKQTNPRPADLFCGQIILGNCILDSSYILTILIWVLVVLRGCSGKKHFYPMFPELIFHKISLWRNIYLQISLEQGWEMLSHFLMICFLWPVVCTRSYLLVSPVLGWRRQWRPTPVLLPGKSHGQRSLLGCSPWGH